MSEPIAYPNMERSVPCNIEAEIGVLGSVLVDGDADSFETISRAMEQGVEEATFFKPAHQMIWDSAEELFRQGLPLDSVSLCDEIQRKGQLEEIGGYNAITQLAAKIDVTSDHQTKHWVNILKRCETMRKLIGACSTTIEQAYSNDPTFRGYEILEKHESAILSLNAKTVSQVEPVSPVVDRVLEQIQETFLSKGKNMVGIPSGLIDLDHLTHGFQNGHMITIAARPSVGKSILGGNVAVQCAMKMENPKPALIFTLEMSSDQLVRRMNIREAGVDVNRLDRGIASKEDVRKIAKAAKRLKEAPIFIDATGAIPIYTLRSRARSLKQKHDIGLVVVDYLQLVKGSGKRQNRETEIGEISAEMKAMAKELDIPVLVLSQLNRDMEREKRFPRLSDLRESGTIEQDSDVVLLMSYNIKLEKGSPEFKRARRIFIAKQRDGPIGDIDVTLRGEFYDITNAAPNPS